MLLAFVFAIVVNQGSDLNQVRQFEQLEHRLAAAWRKRDCAAWGGMLAADWSVIHITGDVIAKEQALSMCKAARPASFEVSIDDVSVRVFGDAAVVTGRTTGTAAGDASKLVLRFTDVFIRRGGEWRVVASQATQVTTVGR